MKQLPGGSLQRATRLAVPQGMGTLYCPECGSENDETLQECTACGALLNAEAAAALAASRPSRPFHLRTLALMAGLGAALVLMAQILGLSFSLAVLPSSVDEGAAKLEAMVEAGTLDADEGRVLALDLMRQEVMRVELEGGGLDGAQAMQLRAKVRPEGQSLVLGLGGLLGFLPPLLALLLAAIATVTVCRVRRPTELALGAGVAVTIQLGIWLFMAELELASLFGGSLHLTRGGFGFAGAPIMLLGMWSLLGVAAAVGVSWAVAAVLEPLTGVAVCDACEHRFSVRKSAPETCPKCNATRRVGARVRYRGGDDFLAELGGTSGGTTLASSGATELLCLRCAKTYAADRCSQHPHEPMLDPRLDAVRFQLMELDASAGTRRYAKWTEGMSIDAAGPTPAVHGPLLCMACARTYTGDRCALHPDEPLLDPSREEVRLELIATDDRRRSRVSTALMFAATAVAGLGAFGLGISLELDASISFGLFAGLLTALVTVSLLVTPALAPPRFSTWTGESQIDLDELGMGTKATVVEPLRRAAARARREAVRVLVAAAVGSALGAAVAAVIDQPFAVFAGVGGIVFALLMVVTSFVVDRMRAVRTAAADLRRAWNDPYDQSP